MGAVNDWAEVIFGHSVLLTEQTPCQTSHSCSSSRKRSPSGWIQLWQRYFTREKLPQFKKKTSCSIKSQSRADLWQSCDAVSLNVAGTTICLPDNKDNVTVVPKRIFLCFYWSNLRYINVRAKLNLLYNYRYCVRVNVVKILFLRSSTTTN